MDIHLLQPSELQWFPLGLPKAPPALCSARAPLRSAAIFLSLKTAAVNERSSCGHFKREMRVK